ncbi:MAG TPA: hypothetical protein VEA41_22495 [Salinarimonas sp.]|nr:hypothetical protein [Salinarimonas sp.]
MMLALALALTLAAAALAPAAHASAFCEIKPTADGYVALREGPGASARLLERMTSKDEIMLGPGRRGAWVEVVYWRGGRFASGLHETGDPPTARGWMHSGLVAPDSCG